VADIALRELANVIRFDIDEGPLKEADAMMDKFRSRVEESSGSLEEMGESGESALGTVESKSKTAKTSLQSMSKESRRGGKEMKTTYRGVGGSLQNLSSQAGQAFSALRSGMMGIMATGFAGKMFQAASNIETLEIQLRHAAETESEWASFTDEMERLEELSGGMYRQGDLMGIARQATQMGFSLQEFGEIAEDAMVLAEARGVDFDRMMRQLNETIAAGVVSRRQFVRLTGIDLEQALQEAGYSMADFRSEMDATQRRQLLYNLIQQQSGEHMDAFEEVVESGAGSVQAFRGALGDMVEIMGEPLLDPLSTVMQWLTDIFDMIRDDPIGEQMLKWIGWGTAIGGVSMGVLGLYRAFQMLLPVITAAAVPFLKFAVIGSLIFLAVEDIVGAFMGLEETITEDVYYAITEDFLGLEGDFGAFRDSVIEKLDAVGRAMGGLFDGDWDMVAEAYIDFRGIDDDEFASQILNDLIAGLAAVGLGVKLGPAGALIVPLMLAIDWEWVGDSIVEFLDGWLDRLRDFTGADDPETAARELGRLEEEEERRQTMQERWEELWPRDYGVTGRRRVPFEDFVILKEHGLHDEFMDWYESREWGRFEAPTLEEFLEDTEHDIEGYREGTPWTGSGPADRFAGFVHNREAVIPEDTLREGPGAVLSFLGMAGFREGYRPGLIAGGEADDDPLDVRIVADEIEAEWHSFGDPIDRLDPLSEMEVHPLTEQRVARDVEVPEEMLDTLEILPMAPGEFEFEGDPTVGEIYDQMMAHQIEVPAPVWMTGAGAQITGGWLTKIAKAGEGANLFKKLPFLAPVLIPILKKVGPFIAAAGTGILATAMVSRMFPEALRSVVMAAGGLISGISDTIFPAEIEDEELTVFERAMRLGELEAHWRVAQQEAMEALAHQTVNFILNLLEHWRESIIRGTVMAVWYGPQALAGFLAGYVKERLKLEWWEPGIETLTRDLEAIGRGDLLDEKPDIGTIEEPPDRPWWADPLQMLPGFQRGTPWTGHGPLSEPAGVVHRQEAVVPWETLRGGAGAVLDFLGMSGGGFVFSPQVQVTVDASGEQPERAAERMREAVEYQFDEMMERYYARMRKKAPQVAF